MAHRTLAVIHGRNAVRAFVTVSTTFPFHRTEGRGSRCIVAKMTRDTCRFHVFPFEPEELVVIEKRCRAESFLIVAFLACSSQVPAAVRVDMTVRAVLLEPEKGFLPWMFRKRGKNECLFAFFKVAFFACQLFVTVPQAKLHMPVPERVSSCLSPGKRAN